MARMVTLNIVVGEPDMEAAATCPDCQFDAVLRFPLYGLSENGVSEFGHYIICVRCSDPGA